MLNRSPQHADTLDTCLRSASPGDTVLLLEDGVYLAAQASLPNTEKINLVALHTDVAARGLSGRLHPAIRVISDAEWVQLACNAHSVCNWN